MSRITWTGEGQTHTIKAMCAQWRIARKSAEKRGYRTLFGCGVAIAACAKMQLTEKTPTHAASLVMPLGVLVKVS